MNMKLPAERFFGQGALERALPSLCRHGKKAFLVAGRSMIRQGYVKALQDKLRRYQMESIVFSGVSGEPTDRMISEGIEQYQRDQCDCIIGFGGGSQLDAAKAIGAMAVHQGMISDYNGKLFDQEIPFLVEIPSTAGTGSEATQVTIITDTRHEVKMLLKGSVLMPNMAIVDPLYTMKVPADITAWTGLDALTHAVEAYTSKHAFPECDEYAVSAIKRIFKYLPISYHDGENKEARTQMSLAAYEAGVTICNSTVTIVHGMSRPIGAVFHIPHGLSNAMLLDKCLSFALDGAVERFAQLGIEIGVATAKDHTRDAAEAFIRAIRKLCRELNVPTLLEYGITKEDFDKHISKMALDAKISGSPDNTRKNVTVENMESIYKMLYE